MKFDLRRYAVFLAVLVVVGASSALLRKKTAVQAAAVQAPKFEVDLTWPKPLPNHWILGRPSASLSMRRITSGSFTGRARSNAWRATRSTIPPTASAALPAPPVLEFDQAGNLLEPLGRTRQRLRLAGFESTASPSITKATCGSAATAMARGDRGPLFASPDQPEGHVGRAGQFNDNMVLKFTQEGKFLMQIGKPGKAKAATISKTCDCPRKTCGRSQDQRTVCRRRLRQPSRDRIRRRNRQIQAPLGRIWPQARRRRSRHVQSRRPARPAVPQSGPLRRALARRTAVCLRSRK